MAAIVEIYATSFCRHCVAARELLGSRKIEFTEYLLDLYPLEKNIMIKRCGQRSVPQIFIHDRHIGGHAELIALASGPDLDKLLAEAPLD
jgi:glutaredoxin 3